MRKINKLVATMNCKDLAQERYSLLSDDVLHSKDKDKARNQVHARYHKSKS